VTAFTPTHLIRFTSADGKSIDTIVQLCEDEHGAGGPAFTREEWESDLPADWERHEDGSWTCLGAATPGGANGTVEVLAVEHEGPVAAPEIEVDMEAAVGPVAAPEIEVDMEAAVGPVARVQGEASLEEIEAALPEGWALSETPAVRNATGGWSYPLVRPEGAAGLVEVLASEVSPDEHQQVWGDYLQLEQGLRALARDARQRWQSVPPTMPPFGARRYVVSSSGTALTGTHQLHFGAGVDALYGEYGVRAKYATQEDFDAIVLHGLRTREAYDRAAQKSASAGRVDFRLALVLALLALAALWLAGGSCSGWIELGDQRVIEVAP